MDDTVTVETWVLLGMLATEIDKVAGDAAATRELAERVRGISEAVRNQSRKG